MAKHSPGKTHPRILLRADSRQQFPEVTAIKVEVPPLDSDKARINPEDGFIVEEVRASVIYPDGRKERLAFRSFLQDSEGILRTAVTPPPHQQKMAKKKKSGPERICRSSPSSFVRAGSLAFSPIRNVCPRIRVQVDLKQLSDIDSKPAIVRRAARFEWRSRLDILCQDPARVPRSPGLTSLNSELPKSQQLPFP